MKAIWAAVGGVALLGTAGAVGVIVASPGGQEELVQQVDTATATAIASPAASGTPVPSPASAPSSTPLSTPGETFTYTDPTYGYSFDYPSKWYLSPPKDNGGQLILYSYDLASIPPEEAGMPVPKDKLKAFFWVAEGVDKPLEQWLAEGRAQASAEQNLPPPTVISQSPTMLADKQGLVEITESEGINDLSYYIDLGGGRVFVVNAAPADSEVLPEFERVLATVRFAP